MTSVLLASLISLSGCATAERIDYVHQPTKDLRKTYDIEDDALRPFTIDGVVMAPVLKLSEGDSTRIILDVLADSKRKVMVRNLLIKGAGPAKEIPLELTIAAKTEKKPGVLSGSETLATFSKEEMEAFTKAGTMTINLQVKVPPSKKFTPIDYVIERVSTTQLLN